MSGQARCFLALPIVLAGMLLPCPSALSLDRNLDVKQYAHRAWTVRDGFVKGNISSIAQMPDGYLWLGTQFGLLRFDGIRGVPWQPPADQHLPSDLIMSLLATHDGTLWIGTYTGLASWKDGRLTQYPELSDHFIFKILEDHNGTLWASGYSPLLDGGKLCAIRNTDLKCYGEDGILGRGVFNLFEDSKGNLWAGVKNGLWRWRPGPPRFYPLAGNPDGIQALGEDTDGTLLVGWNGGLYRFVDEKPEPLSLPGVTKPFVARRLLWDGDGGLWIGTAGLGVLHVHRGKSDVYAQADALSGDFVHALFQDREGNIWVTTGNGLDRFCEIAVATITTKQGLSQNAVGSVLADRNGSVWLATYGGLNRWNNGQIETYRTGEDKSRRKVNEHPTSLFQDDRGRVWVSMVSQLGYLEHDRFVPVTGLSGGVVLSITEDRAGDLWAADERVALFQLREGRVVRQIPWSELGRKDYASSMSADPHDGIWLGFFLGGIAHFADGQIRARYGSAEGLGEGRVGDIRFDRDGVLWASTGGGLSRLKNGRIATLSSKSGLPCDTVHWSIEDDDHAFWLYMPCGLVRIARPELDSWVAAVDQNKDTKPAIHPTVFDSFDGVRSLASPGHFNPQVAKTPDGRVWFLPWDGVSVLDPRNLHLNKLPPPVHIEQITADRKVYDVTASANGSVRLPPLIRDLQIDYTALSLVSTQKVMFRYKLEGRDRDWQEAGSRRQAFYSDLPPGNYTFRVMACNNSGVWNEAGTSLDFFVAPAFYQTWWFRSVCVVAFLGLLVALYQLRLRQLSRQFNMRLEARVAERTRIARDLHDTLLQSFQGALLKFHAVTYMLLDRPEVQRTLETAIEQARQAITEGRDAVQGMRSSTLIGNDLARTLGMLGEGLAAEHGNGKAPEFCVQVQGTTRELAPLVRDDVYRIASEALRNAFRHAHAARIEVEIRYDPRQLRLRVRDNGRGIEPKFLDRGGRAGHYGLPGMHERAKLVGGKLTIWSELNSGAEAELTIPAAVAYAKSGAAHRSFFWQKGA